MKTLTLSVFLFCMPMFAATHLVSNTLKPSAKLVYKGAKTPAHLAVYPLRHPKKDVHAAKRASVASAKAAKAAFLFTF